VAFEIRTADGEIYAVHTEVGDGLTRVVVLAQRREPVAVEPQQEGE
jgi:hypothetical protein